MSATRFQGSFDTVSSPCKQLVWGLFSWENNKIAAEAYYLALAAADWDRGLTAALPPELPLDHYCRQLLALQVHALPWLRCLRSDPAVHSE